MKDHYAERAPVYDRVYHYPERQADLRSLEAYLSSAFDGRDVLEVAAGTGYWTHFLSLSARSITATDSSLETLRLLQQRRIQCPLTVKVSDAHTLEGVQTSFSGAFAGLWFSHVPRQQHAIWLRTLTAKLKPGATVILLDNTTAQCQRLPITETDAEGNTYQTRVTDAGNSYRIMKNFPTEADLREASLGVASNPRYQTFEHFWLYEFTCSGS